MTTVAAVVFCPSCHRRVELPAVLTSGNIKLGEGGTINVNCGNCGRPVTVAGKDG